MLGKALQHPVLDNHGDYTINDITNRDINPGTSLHVALRNSHLDHQENRFSTIPHLPRNTQSIQQPTAAIPRTNGFLPFTQEKEKILRNCNHHPLLHRELSLLL
ncbi:hypothetical protein RB195_005219 [Necator americanus]